MNHMLGFPIKNYFVGSISKPLTFFFALLIFFLGISVSVNWLTNSISFIQIYTNMFGMGYAAAVCFIICSVGLFAALDQNRFITMIAGILLLLINILILIQIFLNLDLRIGNLLISQLLLQNNNYSKMLPTTSLVFLVTGILFLLLSIPQRVSKCSLYIVLLTGLTLAFATFVFLCGTLYGIPAIYYWEKYFVISSNTQFGFILLGFGFCSLACYISTIKEYDLKKLFPFVFELIGLLLVLLLWRVLLTSEFSHIKQIIKFQTIDIADNVQENLQQRVTILQRMALHLGNVGNSSDAVWKIDAASYINDFSNQLALIHVDNKFKIRSIVQNNKSFNNTILNKLFQNLKFKKAISKNQKFGMIIMSDLMNEKNVLLIFSLISSNNKNSGMIISLVDLNSYFSNIINPKNHEQYTILVVANQHLLYAANNTTEDYSVWGYNATFKLDKNDWHILLKPRSFQTISLMKSSVPNTVLIIGIIIVTLITLISWLLRLTFIKAKQLAVSEENLLHAQQVAHLGYWELNVKNNTIWISKEAQAIMDCDKSSFAQQEFTEFLHPDYRNHFSAEMKKLLANKKNFSGIYKIIKQDKSEREIYFDANIKKIADNKVLAVNGIIQDISEMRSLQQQLQQSQKMELLGQMTGGIAHDFNNLLMMVQGNLELMMQEVTEGSKQFRRLQSATNATGRASELTKRLLAFSRKQVLQPKLVDLKISLLSTIKLIKPTLGDAIAIDYNIPDDVWMIWVDPGQLDNALINLAVNARDAMANISQATLNFDISNIAIDEPLVADKYNIKPGNYVKIAVTDNGSGISPEVLSRVFEPFFTTKEVGKGSGLGLSMVYGFATQSKGHVTIYSELNHGTTFTLYLPCATEAQHQKEDETIETVMENLQGTETILLAEDEIDLRQFTAEYLRGLGYTVLEAADGPAALTLISKKPKIDLLFTDVIMPGGMTGSELAQKVREAYPSIKVICVTGYAKSALANVDPTLISAIFTKPYKLSELAKKLREILS